MLDVATFLLRWIFLSNLTRDIADLQTIPQQMPSSAPQLSDGWRDYCVNGILQYPPGLQRRFSLDALRLELVHQLEMQWMADDATLLLHRNGQLPAPDNTSGDTVAADANTVTTSSTKPPPRRNHDAAQSRQRSQSIRDYLPQLVSAVLHSPSTSDQFPALSQLRSVLLQRCQDDPSFGIELCWLLEAQVGRTWRTLLEQSQTSRLVLLLPEAKAAAIARIGRDKRQAFDLLQQAEQATAYGAGLPASLGERRCAHFGDTMHWMDRLSLLSSELRRIPESERAEVLEDRLEELNRRIRRRMVTRGTMSLEVEDNLRSDDWPRIDDMSLDVIDHSIHLPLIPQTKVWPNGQDDMDLNGDASTHQVVRVLNIVASESRLLSSRERCPFVVHVEVADSGLEGTDARLYTVGATGLGATMEEALASTEARLADEDATETKSTMPRYSIPRELVADDENENNDSAMSPAHSRAFVSRGGSSLPSYNGYGGRFYDPLGTVSARQVEPFQNQLYQEQRVGDIQESFPRVTVGKEFLDGIFGQEWTSKCREIRAASPYGHVKGWRLASFIIKAGEDIRRESFVMQVISKLKGWFAEEIPEKYRPFMRPYTIMCVGADAGLLECLSDAKSVDEIKKKTDGFASLRDYFVRAYGPPQPNHQRIRVTDRYHFQLPIAQSTSSPPTQPSNTPERDTISFGEAQMNFLRSLVGYSLVCYILQVKDRHNANILLDRLGHIIHIDFGFVLGDTPKMSKVPIFSERAPFKLSAELWEVLGGWSGLGTEFCRMFELAFLCAARHVDEIAALTESTLLSMEYSARSARLIANGVRDRLQMRGAPGSKEQKMFVIRLVNDALTSWGTNTYDWLQRNMNGYM